MSRGSITPEYSPKRTKHPLPTDALPKVFRALGHRSPLQDGGNGRALEPLLEWPQGHVIVAETLVPASVHHVVDFFGVGR